jgi:hypothetical protein
VAFAVSDLFRFSVVRPEPQLLQFRVVNGGEGVRLEDGVQLLEGLPVEGDAGPGAQHRLVPSHKLRRRQRPQETRQLVCVTALLQGLANASDLRQSKFNLKYFMHNVNIFESWIESRTLM